jgi:hypothetical protein
MGRLPKGLIEDLLAERMTVVGCAAPADAKALAGNRRDRNDLRDRSYGMGNARSWYEWRGRNNLRDQANKAHLLTVRA